MNENKTTQIKNTTAKIDLDKINSYLQEHSTSTSLKEIIKYSKRILESNEEEKVFKLAVHLAYDLDTLVNKTDYVKNEKEKKLLLEIAKELFENTIGYKEKK
jgi:GTP-binding protein EngB required for normal cell division